MTLPTWSFLRNVLLKALLLLLLVNLIFAAWFSPERLGCISAYNRLFPGRERFPFGEDPQHAYNLSLYNFAAMFAAHTVSAPAPAGEYRLFLLGDSSVWGSLLTPEETLAGRLNALNLTCRGRRVRSYNLGYPTLSLTKDLMVLDEALRYRPDAIVWLVTLESFPEEMQLASPVVANNPQRVQRLRQRYDLRLPGEGPAEPTFWERTLIGQRRALADLARLQLYGVLWVATGIDQAYPPSFRPAQRDLEADTGFHGRRPPDLSGLAFEVLEAGLLAAGDLPVLLVNEPVMLSSGQNAQIRYNFYYPRWAYDQYRRQMAARARQSGWRYLDLWDTIPEAEFTNSAIHLTPGAETRLAERIAGYVRQEMCLGNK